MKNFLSEKEIIFCRYYCSSFNAKEAAIKAGYPIKKAEKIAIKLLNKKEAKNFIKKTKTKIKKDKILNLAVLALKKIIFYRPNDIVNLLNKFKDMPEKEIATLDLFSISEIKKLKDGNFEFKFIDRLKAIDILLNIANKMDTSCQANNFLKALTAKSAYISDE